MSSRATVADVPGFLLSRRWLLFAVAVAVLGVACWRLGVWQFQRLEERRADNSVIARNLEADPVPVTTVLAADRPLGEQEQWRRVWLRGRYAAAEQVLVRYQTRDGRPGATVVTPMVLDSGEVALVDRGWMPVTNDPSAQVEPPAPPVGEVTVTGWARPDQSGDPAATTPVDGQVRLISSAGFTDTVPGPL
ncbi:MAG: SURF1 family protein, partial [Actinomycetota bacterium]|nr:SURF1 family protein [Actinomycetota bacterium]